MTDLDKYKEALSMLRTAVDAFDQAHAAFRDVEMEKCISAPRRGFTRMSIDDANMFLETLYTEAQTAECSCGARIVDHSDDGPCDLWTSWLKQYPVSAVAIDASAVPQAPPASAAEEPGAATSEAAPAHDWYCDNCGRIGIKQDYEEWAAKYYHDASLACPNCGSKKIHQGDAATLQEIAEAF